MPHLVVAAAGPDQPGIVAEFTRVFLQRGCNLEDTSMTVLRGQFAMMLVVDAPSEITPSVLERELSDETALLGLVVSVWQIPDAPVSSPRGEPWTVSIYGADRPGIVHRISKALAERDVNIADLETRLVGPDKEPIYSMILDVTIPPSASLDDLRAELNRVAGELGVECRLHPADADVL
jgi:glycine cleavage system transcriptional repressor